VISNGIEFHDAIAIQSCFSLSNLPGAWRRRRLYIPQEPPGGLFNYRNSLGMH
jgi:hypothetical protein